MAWPPRPDKNVKPKPAPKQPVALPDVVIKPGIGKKGKGNEYDRFIREHKGLERYKVLIAQWAGVYGIPAIQLAALIWHESVSVAKRQGVSPEAILSPTGEGFGLAQINPKVWFGKTFGPTGETITQEWAQRPGNAIQFAAWYINSFMRQGLTFEQAYVKYYKGPNAPAAPDDFDISKIYKGYNINVPGRTPRQDVLDRQERDLEKQRLQGTLYDRWVVRNPNGTLGFAKIKDVTTPPKNVVVSYGQPLRLSQFQEAKTKYDSYFFTYLGRPATNREVAALLAKPLSEFQLAQTLSRKPGFRNSPIWKAHANGIVGAARQLYGQNWKPNDDDQEFIRRAIVENWDSATLQTNLRNRKAFLAGPVFKDGVAKFSNVFQTIYGRPGKDAQQVIREAVANGWTEDEFAYWLRGQDSYTSSPEYLNKALELGEALGLITGRIPTLVPGAPPANTQPKGGPLPDNKLVAGKPVKKLAPRLVDGKPLVAGTLNA